MSCKKHELAYNTAYGKPNESFLILQADVALEKNLAGLTWSTLTAGEAVYGALMAGLFSLKIGTVDIAGAAVEALKADARAANLQIVNGGNGAVGKSFTDTSGNQVSCARDASGNITFSCNKTLDTGAKVEGTLNTATNASTVKTTSTDGKKIDTLKDTDGDGDGKITSGRELFGNHTLLKNGAEAANGFEALRDLDDNRDGITDAGELLTLDAAGVRNLKVAYTAGGTDAQGNTHKQLGGYTKTDGSTQQMDDVWFAVDANYLNVANDKDWRAAA